MNTNYYLSDDKYKVIADNLSHQGYCIFSDFLPPELTSLLHQRVLHLDDEDFQLAGVGREKEFHLKDNIRRDETRWLTPNNTIDNKYLMCMSLLKKALNRHLFLGLLDYESHYAHYAPGAFYKKHIDAFQGIANRLVSTVLYLNQDWQKNDGGQLLLYHPQTHHIIESIDPEYGKFVVFLSEEFPHEVIKSERDRYSIAGWFRIDRPLL